MTQHPITMNRVPVNLDIQLLASGRVLPAVAKVPVRGEAWAVIDPGCPESVDDLRVEVRNRSTGEYVDLTHCLSDALIEEIEQLLILEAYPPF